ncbi:hypothetical protein SmJEL517_g01109 [Synchytrium microbalum]|uniref:RRM domain-containing protein n=1 Tax=Synchytrium microbalum TaxID=1806994 RepID=A0A507CGX8_9FUNG|nr:uncharacterized protein SmJEL517_g01109 [Synchytrium microbalum]TPX37244.1 hypothetical protein SmJEL517_g01109 [Synchytrium microbalum]
MPLQYNGNLLHASPQLIPPPMQSMPFTPSHQEDVTTIFVVGFPEDMKEREFQNFFIFCPGFEAATLKVPNASNGTMGNDDLTGGKRQIIGFAKFRTRLEALEARDTLSGRKVDVEKGSVLKAEMAKKNLYTKRGLSNEAAAQLGLVSPLYLSMAQQAQQMSRRSVMHHAPSYSRPSPDLYEDYTPSESYMDYGMQRPTSPGFPDTRLQYGGMIGGGVEPSIRPPVERFSPSDIMDNSMMSTPQQQRASLLSRVTSAQNLASIGGATQTPLSASLPERRYSESNAFYRGVNNNGNNSNNPYSRQNQQQQQQQYVAPIYTTNEPTPPTTPPGQQQSIISAGAEGIVDRFGSFSLTAESDGKSPLPSRPSLLSRTSSSNVSPVSPVSSYEVLDPRIVDSPPSNTLYVGNVPITALEEEVRAFFARTPGYKGVYYRQGLNGQLMTLVEYVDIASSTAAMQQLYGRQIGGKGGGIWMSYFEGSPFAPAGSGSVISGNGSLPREGIIVLPQSTQEKSGTVTAGSQSALAVTATTATSSVIASNNSTNNTTTNSQTSSSSSPSSPSSYTSNSLKSPPSTPLHVSNMSSDIPQKLPHGFFDAHDSNNSNTSTTATSTLETEAVTTGGGQQQQRYN